MTFHIGQTVRCIKDLEGQFRAGGLYTITKIHRKGYGRLGDMLCFDRDDQGSYNGWLINYFIPVQGDPFQRSVRDYITKELS